MRLIFYSLQINRTFLSLQVIWEVFNNAISFLEHKFSASWGLCQRDSFRSLDLKLITHPVSTSVEPPLFLEGNYPARAS